MSKSQDFECPIHNAICQADCASCPLFRNLSRQEHYSFLEKYENSKMDFAKGEVIVRQGDTIHSIWLLMEGSVRTQMITKEGNIVEIEMLEAIIPLAPAFVYANEGQYPVDIIALESCTLLRITKDDWMHEMKNNEKLLINFLTLSANMTSLLANKLQMISLKSLKYKLSIFLLEKTSSEKNSFILKRSRTQLAEYFGVQRPSLARSFKELEDEGLIKTDGRLVSILDRNRLSNL